ncbi:phage tail tape measure protein [Sphingomonas oligophenolica]|uniref:Phage tail tape measure protein n=2 Tax=Sphingomonas oligophenolica TaxID=301154 RepID=A0A502CNZ0_9SPHN|nr:phage tail tape measure protein [Sphingomonas oligophenolica]
MLLEASDKVTRPLRDIAQGSTRAAQALKATRDRLKDIERVQGELGRFRELTEGLSSSETAMKAAQARAAALGRQIEDTAKPTRVMAREFAKAQKEVERLDRVQQTETAELATLRDRLHAAGVATNALTYHENDLRAAAARTNTELEEQSRRLGIANDRARRFANARSRFGNIQGMATGVAASGAAAIGTGVAMAAPLLGGIKSAQDYQSVMTDIAQKTNLSRQEAVKMGAGLLVAARTANQMPADLQAGVDVLSGFGLDPRQAVAMMQPIGRAATAYKAEIADLSAAAFAANSNLKVPIEQTARVIDIMAQAGKSGAFEIKDMAGAFPALTAGYQALGQTGAGAVADLAAALQIARKGAGDSASAATNVANIIQKIASPQTISAFKQFGIDLPASLKKAYAEGKTPLEAIAELTNKATGGDLGKIGFLFQDAQVQQGLRPLIQNLEEYKRIRAEALGAKGVTDSDFAERMKDSAEQTKQLKINALALGINLGTMLLPTINALVQRASQITSRFANWAAQHPKLAKGLALAAGAVAALFLVLGGLAIVIAGLLAPFAALSFAAGALDLALLPVIGIAAAVIAIIAALAAVAYLVISNWGAITGFFSTLWNGVTSTIGRAVDGISSAVSGLWTAIVARFSQAGAAVSGVLSSMWNGVKALFSMGLLDIYKSIFQFTGYILGSLYALGAAAFGWLTGTLPGLLASGVSAAWTALTTALASAFSWLTTTLPAMLVNGVTGAWSAFTAALSAGCTWLTTRLPVLLANGWNIAWTAFKSALRTAFVTLPAMFFDFGAMIIKGLWNGIKSAPGRLWSAGKSLASSLSSGFKAGAGIHSPSRVFMALGGHIIGGLNRGLDRSQGGAVDRISRLTRTMAAALTLPAIALPAIGTPAAAAVGSPVATRIADAAQRIGSARSALPPRLSDAAQLVASGIEATATIQATPARAGAAAINPQRRAEPSPPAAARAPLVIHIHQQPGQSGEDLARIVADEIDRRERAADARSRSSFRDDQDYGSLD